MWDCENMKMRKSESAKMRKCGNATRAAICLLAATLCLGASATGVRMAHDIVLKGGWNAFYLPVTPDVTSDEFFKDWPTDLVACYDAEAYHRTKQFDRMPDDSTLGSIDSRYKVWVRGDSLRTTLPAPLGDAVYVVNITNAAGFRASVLGEPRAMRNVWHVAVLGGDVPVNYLGVSTDGAAADLTDDGYLMGLDTGWTTRWTVGGRATAEKPTLTPVTPKAASVSNGVAVAMDALKTSEWSGPLFVSPVTGLDLGTNATKGVLSVRNDAGTNRLVQVRIRLDDLDGKGVKGIDENLLYYDAGVSNAVWQTNSLATFPYVRELAAGETMSLRLAVDRTRLPSKEGLEYGGILEVSDVSTDRCTHFRSAVPFSILPDGGAYAWTQWPRGLWRTELSLNEVSRFAERKTTQPTPAGAAMNLRLLLYVGEKGETKLVPRVRLGGRRISAAALPPETRELGGSGTFGDGEKGVTFAWTVEEKSKVNPFRHARHPDHDGLLADFRSPAPSGDNFDNYNKDVKPELFSVSNTVTLVWENLGAAAPWNPEETLTGKCEWRLGGLRHEGEIVTGGTFTMQRISTESLDGMRDE